MSTTAPLPERVMRRGVALEFTCPQCQGHCFGSYMTPKDPTQIINVDTLRTELWRHCNRCNQFPHFHVDDDYKFFTVDGKACDTQDEFEALVYHRARNGKPSETSKKG